MSDKPLRSELFRIYRNLRARTGRPSLTLRAFNSAMAEASAEYTADDGTIDGADLRKALLAVCERE